MIWNPEASGSTRRDEGAGEFSATSHVNAAPGLSATVNRRFNSSHGPELNDTLQMVSDGAPSWEPGGDTQTDLNLRYAA